ncbi:MAG: hypothetical protein ACRCVV_10740 [Shewanella sp.]
MENKVCKGKLFINGTSYADGKRYVGDIYFLADDLNKLDVLLTEALFTVTFNPEVIILPALVAGPLEFFKTQDLQFIYRHALGVDNSDHLNLNVLGDVQQETIYDGGVIYDLLTKDNRFFTSKLLFSKPINSFKVKTISEMERIEELLKEADLQLSPEQEVKLLRKIVEEQQVIINNLQGI